METFICKICGQTLGGTKHNLVRREGHIRIVNGEASNDGTNKSLNQLMNESQKEKNIQFKGFKQVNYEFFVKKHKNVRNISDITYRILSFIFFSCIYYCEKLDYLDNNTLRNFYFKNGNEQNNNILFILRKIWEILTEELMLKNINNIQCFINMILPDLSKIIRTNQKIMNNFNERNEFEIICNKTIENAIKNYNNYYTNYIINNK